MKKKFGVISMVLIATLMLFGCSKGTEEVKEVETPKEISEDIMTADLVVIGGGGSGMSAALEASQGGAKVVLLEKMSLLGGNTMRATGGYNAIGTDVQEKEGIVDSKEVYLNDLIKEDTPEYEQELINAFADNSLDTFNWIVGKGVELVEVVNSAGNSVKRLHRPEGGAPVGVEVVKVLSEEVKNDENIDLLLDTSAAEIVKEDGKITAVIAEGKDGQKFTIETKAVLIATGSYGKNEEIVEKYRPDLKGFISTNHPGATGDGIILAENAGAELYKMENITIHPTVNVDKGIMISEGVRGVGAIVVNKSGERFVAETDPSNSISDSIFSQDDQVGFLLFDDAIRNNMGAIEGYIKQGIITEAETLEELADKLGITDSEQLEKTIEEYNGFAANGKDEKFDRQNIEVALSEGPFYGSKIAPAIHGTKGGIKITPKTEVLGTDGNIIEGLYSSGECTGGVRGLADSLIFGRIAGQSVLELLNK